MNDAERPEASRNGTAGHKEEPDGEASQGPSLILLYSLITLALAVAIALAALIVLPFYQRR
ncbi:MAG: hypothetical protein ABSD59_01455 [Terracidiphilus sp.]|jgi:hypothetical protein